MTELIRIIENIEIGGEIAKTDWLEIEVIDVELSSLRTIRRNLEKFLNYCKNNPEFKGFVPMFEMILYGEEISQV